MYPLTSQCKFCKKQFSAKVHNAIVCNNCRTNKCKCKNKNCNNKIFISNLYSSKKHSGYCKACKIKLIWKDKLKNDYHSHLKGKSYLDIYGTTNVPCGYQRGDKNMAKRKDIRKKNKYWCETIIYK